jgi:predicted CopG family antitoxin
VGYRTVSLSDKAYKKLAAMKRKNESFTDLILRLEEDKPKRPISSFAGRWNMPKEEVSKIFKEIGLMWKRYEEDLIGH